MTPAVVAWSPNHWTTANLTYLLIWSLTFSSFSKLLDDRVLLWSKYCLNGSFTSRESGKVSFSHPQQEKTPTKCPESPNQDIILQGKNKRKHTICNFGDGSSICTCIYKIVQEYIYPHTEFYIKVYLAHG